MNKKGQLWKIIVPAIIAIAILAFVLIFFFGSLFPGTTGKLNTILEGIDEESVNQEQPSPEGSLFDFTPSLISDFQVGS